MIQSMIESELQDICRRGQLELMETRYLEAARTLARAERAAWESRSFDTLARLYLPLQEARRQIRQRCGEGAVRMHVFQSSPAESIAAEQVLRETPHGQLLVAGWGTIEPALEVRRLAAQQGLYVETFLGSVEAGGTLIEILPVERWDGDCLILKTYEIPQDAPVGNAESFAGVMALWERLHTPFLLAAKKEADPILRMQVYRFTLEVDPACELAHQYLAEIARDLARG